MDLSLDAVERWREYCRYERRKVVLTNGCFDLLHVGHIRCLQQAKSLGDALLVAINSDESVRGLKGDGRPIVTQNERAEILLALECVEMVVVFPEERLTKMIHRLKPDVYAKGGDYDLEKMDQEERKALTECGSKISFLQFVDGCSTTELLKRI